MLGQLAYIQGRSGYNVELDPTKVDAAYSIGEVLLFNSERGRRERPDDYDWCSMGGER